MRSAHSIVSLLLPAYLCVPSPLRSWARRWSGRDDPRRRGFARPVLPDSPVIFSAVPTFVTQRVSRGKPRLLSVRLGGSDIRGSAMTDIGLCLVLSAGGGPRPYPASNLPALYLAVRGRPVRRPALLLRGCRSFQSLSPPARLPRCSSPSGVHHCATLSTGVASFCEEGCLQLPFASVGLGLDFALYACHNIRHHHLAAGPCPAHNKTLK